MKRFLPRLMSLMKPHWQLYLSVALLGLLSAGLEMIPTRLVGDAITLISTGQFTLKQVGGIIVIWVGTAYFNQFLYVIQYRLAARAGETALSGIRRSLFDRVLGSRLNFFQRYPTGTLLQGFAADLQAMRMPLTMAVHTLATNIGLLVFSAIMIWNEDSRLFLSVVWLAPIIFVLNFRYGRRVSEFWRRAREAAAKVGSSQAESIMGAQTVSAYNRQEDNLIRFNELQDLHAAERVLIGRENAAFQSALQGIRFIGQAILLAYGGYLVASGRLAPGDYVSASLYWEWLMVPAINFGSFYNDLMVSKSGADRVFNLLDEPVEPEGELSKRPYLVRTTAPKIEFEHVNFAYALHRKVIKDLCLKIEPAETVAIVGATGSGKSTLLLLIAGLYEPQKGLVKIGGRALKEIPKSELRSQIAMVPQANVLFQGTILENIRYDRADLNDEEIFSAARELGCYERFASLPEGYSTMVGEGGGRLSLGERQLICFLRALVRKPLILLLDEATSALDESSDSTVRAALYRMTRGRTTILVTHRLSSAIHADRVVLMSQGRLVATGRHEELLQSSGAYAQLFKNDSEQPLTT